MIFIDMGVGHSYSPRPCIFAATIGRFQPSRRMKYSRIVNPWKYYIPDCDQRSTSQYILQFLFESIQCTVKWTVASWQCRSHKYNPCTGVSIPLWPRLCSFCSAHSESSLWAGKNKHNLGDNGMDTPVDHLTLTKNWQNHVTGDHATKLSDQMELTVPR